MRARFPGAWFWSDGRTPRPARRWVRLGGWVAVAALAALALTVAGLPVRRPAFALPTVIYGDQGRVLATLYARGRVPVTLAEVPPDLQRAVVAAEDADFWSDFGVNPRALVRAAWVDLRARRIVEGGSTIAQQLAKTLFLTPARTLSRKAVELLYTLRLEATYSKAQILQMYLNAIYLGDGAYGVGAASLAYFGKPVARLDLAQCALLAGLIRAPQAYSPFLHPAAARAVRANVLQRMRLLGDITPAQAAAATAEPLGVLPAGARGPAPEPYYVAYVLGQAARGDPALVAAMRRGGYLIYTTLDRGMQQAAQAAFRRYMPTGKADVQGIVQPEGALVAIDPRTGAIRAMVGGRGNPGDAFNRAVDAHRQPGSTFKPFLYATVLHDGYTVVDRQMDAPVVYPGAHGQVYRPTDYGSVPYLDRELTVREALALSDNVVAVKWADLVGPAQVIATARRMGITSPLQPTLPLVLGAYSVTPLEMADAYAPLANGGMAEPAWSIRKVVGPGGPLPVPARPKARRALDPGVAYIVTSLLESVMTQGTGRHLLPILQGRPVAGKTGTTNGNKDAWFVGYTPDLAAAVWVGDDIPRHMPNGYGSVLAGPVWAHFMASALAGTEPQDWAQPADVVTYAVSADDGLLPNPTSPVVDEVFLRGTQPTAISPIVARSAPPAGGGPRPGDTEHPPEDWPPPPLQPPGVPPVARVPLE